MAQPFGFCHALGVKVAFDCPDRLRPVVRQCLGARGDSVILVALLAAMLGVACSRSVGFTSASDSRCADGLTVDMARCCAPGQVVSVGHCVGKPTSCPDGWRFGESPATGCIWASHAILVAKGHYVLGPNDWESEHIRASEAEVGAFWLDATEVTIAQWTRCMAVGACSASPIEPGRAGEPGLPVVNVTAGEAETFCAWANGRLPRTDEWLRVTAGANSRRFPWGQTGLVCRRASFGLVRGPCAEGGTTPDLAASRPDGKSELGLYDLVGNVAEIVRSNEAAFEVRGGSFRSDHAAALKSWSSIPYVDKGPDIGFRCAYDRDPEAH